MFFKRRLLFIFVLASLPSQAVSRLRPFFQASRALAMGDAFTAYDRGFEAVYYNPAGVARKSKPEWKYFDLEFLSTLATYDLFKSSLLSLGSMKKIIANVAADPGKIQAMGVSFLPQFMARNFSMGVVARTYADAYVDPTSKNLSFYGIADFGLYTHLGASLFGGVLKLGVGLKALDRGEVDRLYTPTEYASGLSFTTQWKEGVGYGLDLGMLLTAPIAFQPTIGLAVEDVGNTKLLDRRLIWSGSRGIPGSPESLQQKINTGLSFIVKHSAGVKSGFAFDLKDIAHVSQGYTERIHAGWELDYKNSFFFRAGLNQGRYWTAGIGINVISVGIEVATYGENLLAGTGGRLDDRKILGRYVLVF